MKTTNKTAKQLAARQANQKPPQSADERAEMKQRIVTAAQTAVRKALTLRRTIYY